LPDYTTQISLQSSSILLRKYHIFYSVKTINLPFLADSINEGTIAEFVKKQGQWINQDETVANIETDKVTIEFKSPESGLITKFYVNAGDNVGVGKPVYDVDTDAPKPEGSAPPKAEEKKVDAPKSEAPKSTESKPAAKEAPKAAEKPKSEPPKPTPVFSGTRT